MTKPIDQIKTEILDAFREKFDLHIYDGITAIQMRNEMQNYLSESLTKLETAVRKEQLEWCGCMKCKLYKNSIVDRREVYEKLKSLKSDTQASEEGGKDG